MNKHKIALICAVSVPVLLYAMFLFVLPNVLDLNNYKIDIQKITQENTKLKIDADNIKLVTTPSLHAGVKIDGLKIAYPDNNEFIALKSAQIRIKLLPLLFRTLEIADVNVDSPNLKVAILEDGQLDIIDFANKLIPAESEKSDASVQMPIKFSEKLPKITVNDYSLRAVDKKTGKKVEIKGNNFVLDKTQLNKHFRIASDGQIFMNENKNANMHYDLKIDSFMPALNPSDTQPAPPSANINFINELVQFDLKGDLKTDLKIKEDKNAKGGVKIDGFLNIDKMSAVLDGQQLPQSYASFVFKGNKINAVSDLYISEIEKASIKADINNAKKFSLDLNVKTDKISFLSLQKYAVSLLNSFNIKNDIAQYAVTGYLQSDFALKTDLKKFKSNGYIKAVNGSITHRIMPVSIKAIEADVDFSKNKVNIKNAGALVNGAKLDLKGTIDSRSNADISIVSNSIPLRSIYMVFAPADLKNAYDLQSGILTLNVLIKGKLEDISPKVQVKLNNLKIKDKINGIILSNNQSLVDVAAKGSSFKGNVTVTDSKLLLLNPLFSVTVPSAKIEIDTKDIIVVPFDLFVESSPVKVSGRIKNYMKKPDINITADGNIRALDLKKILPAESRTLVTAQGKLPVSASIIGDDKVINIKAQAKSDAQNHFSPITIKKMLDKNGLLKMSLTIKDNILKINNIGLYTQTNSVQEIALIKGSVADLDKKIQTIKNLDVAVPEPLLVNSSLMPNSSLKIRGRVNVNGKINKPEIKGFFEIKEVNLPEYLTKIDLIDVNFFDSILNADVQNLNVNGNPLNIKAEASLDFNKIFVINSLEVASTNLDADKMIKAMEAQSSSAMTPSSSKTAGSALVFPVKILKGHGAIDKFKMGEIVATNASSDFTMNNDILYLKNLKASAFGGNFEGLINYNLATTAVKAIVHGKSMDSNAALSAFAGVKDQIKGHLNFDADLTLKGVTYETQMKTLKGKAKFSVNEGQLGSLGSFETFLQAGNLLSQSFLQSQIGSVVSAIAPYNTGKFDYLSGEITFKNSVVHLNPIKSSGPHMSLLITGNMHLLNNNASLLVLGSLSPQVVGALGPVGDLSVEKIASYIPKFGMAISSALGAYNEQANEEQLSKIPPLSSSKTNSKPPSKAFKVVVNGNLVQNAPKAIKSFQWLNTAQAMQESQESILKLLAPQITIQGVPVEIPTNKEEVREEIKNQVNNLPQVQKFKENEAVKNFGALYNLYKDKKEPQAQ